MHVFLAFLVFCVFGSQQNALNMLAEQLTKDRGAVCTAPVIGQSTSGTNCGTYEIAIDNSKNVVSLFVQILNGMLFEWWYIGYNKLSNVPTEIGHLTALTFFHASISIWTNYSLLQININQLTNIPTEIGHLTALTWFYASISIWANDSFPKAFWTNSLTSVPTEIGKLTSLTSFCSNTSHQSGWIFQSPEFWQQ